MKKKMKKAFTLVELLVVIAILAILSTVAVVGYNSFTEKARKSADEQAVAQMNTALMAQDINDELNNIIDVQEFLMECDLDIKEYKPLSKDAFFFWDKSENTILYTDKDYKVTYPADQKDNVDTSDWYSLSGELKEEDYTGTIESGAVSVSSAEQLYKLSNKYNGEALTVTLTRDINMMGAAIAFNNVSSNLNIVAASPVTISNIANTEAATQARNNSAGVLRNYGGGLVDNVESNSVTFKNITLSNCVFGDESTGNVGAFVGSLRSGGSVSFENCKVENCVIIGQKKVGSLIGFVQNAGITALSLSVTNTSVVDTVVKVKEGECGISVGCVLGLGESSTQVAAVKAISVSNTKCEFVGTKDNSVSAAEITAANADFFGLRIDEPGNRAFSANAIYYDYTAKKFNK